MPVTPYIVWTMLANAPNTFKKAHYFLFFNLLSAHSPLFQVRILDEHGSVALAALSLVQDLVTDTPEGHEELLPSLLSPVITSLG